VEWREEEVESRYEATLAVGLVIVLQVTLALASLGAGWKLIGLPGWVWLIPVVPETALLLALAWSAPRHRLEQLGHRRTVALALVAVITTANALAPVALIASLLRAQEKSGGELLLKGVTIWGTNVITFGCCSGSSTAAARFAAGSPIHHRVASSSRRMRTRHSPNRTGTPEWPTTCTSRSRMQSPSARRMRCRSPGG
jgi:hypothetical protein